MKKKFLSVMLAGMMLSMTVVGCGDTESVSTIENDIPEVGGNNDSGKVEVEFWYSGGKTAVGVVQEIVDSYNASQDTYVITTVTQADYGETYEKLQAGIAGNAAPDLVLLDKGSARSLSEIASSIKL